MNDRFVDPSTDECPEGFLSIPGLRGYVRMELDGSSVPQPVRDHIARCHACHESYEFLKLTEPGLRRRYRREAVEVAIEQLNLLDWASRDAESSLAHPEQTHYRTAEDVAASLGRAASSNSLDCYAAVREVKTADDVFALCEQVRQSAELPDGRRKRATCLADAFNRYHREPKWDGLLDMLFDSSGLLSLNQVAQERQMELKSVTAFIASFWLVSYIQEASLLRKVGDEFFFDAAELQSLRQKHEAGALR